MKQRLKIAWRFLRDAASEAFRWRDYGAATTALSGAWAALKGEWK